MTPASGRKPKVGDRVWVDRRGVRYYGSVVGFDKVHGQDSIAEFDGFADGHAGDLGDGATNRLFLIRGDHDWGFVMADPINDGGPAFPYTLTAAAMRGMSMRDYFAAKAMGALLSSPFDRVSTLSDALRLMARSSYEIADAMLAERERR